MNNSDLNRLMMNVMNELMNNTKVVRTKMDKIKTKMVLKSTKRISHRATQMYQKKMNMQSLCFRSKAKMALWAL